MNTDYSQRGAFEEDTRRELWKLSSRKASACRTVSTASMSPRSYHSSSQSSLLSEGDQALDSRNMVADALPTNHPHLFPHNSSSSRHIGGATGDLSDGTSMSEDDEDQEWSESGDDDDDGYDELMAEMPIALGWPTGQAAQHNQQSQGSVSICLAHQETLYPQHIAAKSIVVSAADSKSKTSSAMKISEGDSVESYGFSDSDEDDEDNVVAACPATDRPIQQTPLDKRTELQGLQEQVFHQQLQQQPTIFQQEQLQRNPLKVLVNTAATTVARRVSSVGDVSYCGGDSTSQDYTSSEFSSDFDEEHCDLVACATTQRISQSQGEWTSEAHAQEETMLVPGASLPLPQETLRKHSGQCEGAPQEDIQHEVPLQATARQISSSDGSVDGASMSRQSSTDDTFSDDDEDDTSDFDDEYGDLMASMPIIKSHQIPAPAIHEPRPGVLEEELHPEPTRKSLGQHLGSESAPRRRSSTGTGKGSLGSIGSSSRCSSGTDCSGTDDESDFDEYEYGDLMASMPVKALPKLAATTKPPNPVPDYASRYSSDQYDPRLTTSPIKTTLHLANAYSQKSQIKLTASGLVYSAEELEAAKKATRRNSGKSLDSDKSLGNVNSLETGGNSKSVCGRSVESTCTSVSHGSSVSTDSEWSTDGESEDSSSGYDELMAEMPIAVGRDARSAAPKANPFRPAPLPPRPVLPPNDGTAPVKEQHIPEMTDPMEGLAFFQNIRKDLEKVGRMITAKKDGEKFLQRAHILASINWLAANVPACVLDHLGQEIRRAIDQKEKEKKEEVDTIDTNEDASEVSDLGDNDHLVERDEQQKQTATSPRRRMRRRFSFLPGEEVQDKLSGDQLPYVSNFKGALMFVDISGFTMLSTMMDPENLSKVINSYFELIVKTITAFGGDIQKYAGDAVFAEWRASSGNDIDRCVAAAAACAVAMVKDCADFPVFGFRGAHEENSSPLTTLNVHCGVGVGDMIGFHVGDNKNRREYLYLGDPVMQATLACDKAKLGESVASPKFTEEMIRLGFLNASSMSYHVVARRTVSFVTIDSAVYNFGARNARSRGITDHVDGLPFESLKEYRRLISLYCHPVVVTNDVAASHDFKISGARKGARCRREDAELRGVYVMFIKPMVDLQLTGCHTIDHDFINLVNQIMNLITRELNHHVGHLRQCIVDDKGLVLIATFGLRGSMFPNLVTERALPATFAISRALETELRVECKIGATFGDLYCGAVGGENRHEYAVMGPSCNLAARLMASPKNPGILVDNAVRRIASRSYCFNALEEIYAKGYKELVPIFEPLAPLERGWGRLIPNFVGREKEIERMALVAKDMYQTVNADAIVVMVSAPNGMGKSAFLAHAINGIDYIRRKVVAKKSLAIAKHAARDCDSQVAFSTVRSILSKALGYFKYSLDEQSLFSGEQSMFSGTCSRAESVSTGSGSHASTNLTASEITERFHTICRELNPPEPVLQHAQYYLFGIDYNPMLKAPSMRSIASFMAVVVARCFDGINLGLIAIDDIDRTDLYSWKVMRQLFETTENILIIGTKSSSADMTVRVEKDFWDGLNNFYSTSGRFVEIKLDRLNEDEITTMTMQVLGLQRKEVTQKLLDEVLVQSGGVPLFADKILQTIKAEKEGCSKDCATDNSLLEILLHRVDSFDIGVRSILNLCAVIGNSFNLGEVVAVMKEESEEKEAEIRRRTIESLQFLASEGILCVGDTYKSALARQNMQVKDEDNTTFTFFQDIWRSTVLKLLLGSRKRDAHRKIALSLEHRLSDEKCPETRVKIFQQWKGTGDTTKSAESALRAGQCLDSFGRSIESVSLFEETLKIWGWSPSNNDTSTGFTSEILSAIGPADLANVIALLVSMGRSLSLCGRHTESLSTYQKALEMQGSAPAYSQIRDHSVVFPAFTGICDALANGHVQQDVHRRYEQSVLHRFLKVTRIHGRRIHHIHALYMQMELFCQTNEIDKALAVYSIIKQSYKPDKHSKTLRSIYGQDSGALSSTMSAYLQMSQGSHRQAIKTCRYILKEIFPKIETDLKQSFSMVYPLVFALKEAGFSTEAHGLFEKAIVQTFQDQVHSLIIRSVRQPLALLLALSSNKPLSEAQLQAFCTWVVSPDNLCFDDQVNLFLARLGRCGDSITAEICALLATRVPSAKDTLVPRGRDVLAKSSAFLRKHHLKAALTQLYRVYNKLEKSDEKMNHNNRTSADIGTTSVEAQHRAKRRNFTNEQVAI